MFVCIDSDFQDNSIKPNHLPVLYFSLLLCAQFFFPSSSYFFFFIQLNKQRLNKQLQQNRFSLLPLLLYSFCQFVSIASQNAPKHNHFYFLLCMRVRVADNILFTVEILYRKMRYWRLSLGVRPVASYIENWDLLL